MGEVSPIAAKQLVTAVAGEADRNVSAGELGYDGRRQDRAVEERLAEMIEQVGQDRENVAGSTLEFVVRGAESLGHQSSVVRFIVG